MAFNYTKELLIKSAETLSSILEESNELISIFVKSIATAQNKS